MSKETSSVNVRELALGTLLMVLEEDKNSSEVISGVLNKYQFLPKQDRSFYTRLSEGTLERVIELDYVVNQFSKVKVKKMKPVIRTILRMGVYQILYMNQVPDSAACNESVKLAQKKGFHTLKGFVNGVLRNVARQKDTIVYPAKDKDWVAYASVRYSMPVWVLEKWREVYNKDQIEEMLLYFSKESKTTIRVNTTKIDKASFVALLEKEQIKVTQGAYCENALYISDYDSIRRVPGFLEGYFTVQDESSMLSVLCAGIQSGNKVLDACAAPGGKTMLAADLLKGTGSVISCDVTDYKTGRILENKERLGLSNVEVMVKDATLFEPTWENAMDVVIADVPCSGLGVIGKKADIKYHASKEGIEGLRKVQKDILGNVASYVKPGGVLLMSTCTICKEENEENVKWFLEHYPFELESLVPYLPESLGEGTAKEGYLQLLPGIVQTDGFFIARFRKR